MEKKIRVLDLECDGFTPTKIHCIAYSNKDDVLGQTDYPEMVKVFEETDVLIGHSIIRFDIPVAERLLGIRVKANLVDTLALSQYLYPLRKLHGLDSWGEFFGVPKPIVSDWSNLSPEEYMHRCKEDVKINVLLWHKCWDYLMQIYSDDEKRIWSLIKYLAFKMDCIREQETVGWPVDINLVEKTLEEYTKEFEDRSEKLADAMPPIPQYDTKTLPVKPLKKDGTLSAAGANWLQMLENEGLPRSTKDPVKVVKGYERGSAGSTPQLKEWIFSLGWKPLTYKYVRNKKTGEERAIPQLSKLKVHGGGLCESVKLLYDKEPSLELLDRIFTLRHRKGMLSGFLRDMKEGRLKARVSGLTNTLRFKHQELVNLPSADLPYSEHIRGSLITPEGYELCGSDMASLEDRTKQHYIYPYDPEYVEDMKVEGFDPHLDLALNSEMMTREQVANHKAKVENFDHIRKPFKTVNYCATYGGSGKAVSRQSTLSVKEGTALIKVYWARNWAIKEVVSHVVVKHIGDQAWLFNPVSKFWYSLRAEKDIFSTLNQGTGAYCFDVFVGNLRKSGVAMVAQFHDEVAFFSKLGERDKSTKLLQDAISKANDILKLDRDLDVGIEFGSRYSEIH